MRSLAVITISPGIDDNGNGRVDEEPYCTVVPGVSAPPPKDTTLTPEDS
jgi:hypothetical protein